jgi:hypothetical protein
MPLEQIAFDPISSQLRETLCFVVDQLVKYMILNPMHYVVSLSYIFAKVKLELSQPQTCLQYFHNNVKWVSAKGNPARGRTLKGGGSKSTMGYFKQLYYSCRECGHRNRIDKSPLKAAKMVVKGHTFNCRGCGRTMHPVANNRPIFERARKQLEMEEADVHQDR